MGNIWIGPWANFPPLYGPHLIHFPLWTAPGFHIRRQLGYTNREQITECRSVNVRCRKTHTVTENMQFLVWSVHITLARQWICKKDRNAKGPCTSVMLNCRITVFAGIGIGINFSLWFQLHYPRKFCKFMTRSQLPGQWLQQQQEQEQALQHQLSSIGTIVIFWMPPKFQKGAGYKKNFVRGHY